MRPGSGQGGAGLVAAAAALQQQLSHGAVAAAWCQRNCVPSLTLAEPKVSAALHAATVLCKLIHRLHPMVLPVCMTTGAAAAAVGEWVVLAVVLAAALLV